MLRIDRIREPKDFVMKLIPYLNRIRQLWHSTLTRSYVILFLTAISSLAQTPTPVPMYDQITAAYQAGKLQEAEQKLQQILKTRPKEIRALSLLGAVLDSQKRYQEAEKVYKKALQLVPTSPQLNNNLGNHYLARRMTDEAEAAFLRAVAGNPSHINSNLQLATIKVEKRNGEEALKYLSHLPSAEQSTVQVQLLKAQAFFWSGQQSAADRILAAVGDQSARHSRLLFPLAMAFVGMEQYDKAERSFGQALETSPGSLEVLYNLGMASTRAGHLDRGQEIFQKALEKKPEDVDCLLGLARVYVGQGKDGTAVPLLVQANRLAPDRTDVLLLMAQATSNLGFYGDAAIAYERYLKLHPDDDVARRERGFSLMRSFRLKEGIPDLRQYVQKHPSDPVGYYELGVAESVYDKTRSLEHYNQALKLNPHLQAARFGRGVLYLDLDQPAKAMEDLQQFLEQEPGNVHALKQLGRVYLKMDRPEAAAEVLKKAITLAPQDESLYFQYSRAMRNLGRSQEMADALQQFEKLGGGKKTPVARRGLIDFFSLSPDEQRIRYVAGLKEGIRRDPNDFGLKAKLAESLLEEGKANDAVHLFEEIRQSASDVTILTQCGRILIEFEQYEAAKSMLETARKVVGFPKEAVLDLAIATFHLSSPGAGLKLLDEVPYPERTGDYFLLRAQLLDASGRFKEAVEALNESFHANPTRVDLYLQASQFLIKHERYQETIKLLRQASPFIRDVPEVRLVEAIALTSISHVEEGLEKLNQIRAQWPEWYLPYLMNGIYLQNRRHAAEAKPLLETAIALGAPEASAYYYLALAIMELSPADQEQVYHLVSHALKLDPSDPYILTLAGRNALARGEYDVASNRLQEAVRLNPEIIEAHFALSRLYRITGERKKMEFELSETDRLNKENPPTEHTESSLRNLLFSVRPALYRSAIR